MDPVVVRARSADETRAIGGAIASVLEAGDVVMLAGELGAGKTTFVQGVATAMDVRSPVTSPTFVLVREYHGRAHIAHVDVYRLDSLQELYDLGYEELFAPDRIVLVEWGDAVAGALPDDRLEVRLTREDDDTRVIEVRATGASWQPRRDALAAAVAAARA